MYKNQNQVVCKVDINFNPLEESKGIDSKIERELYSRLEKIILTIDDEEVKKTLKDRISKISVLLDNLDGNVKKIKEERDKAKKSDYINLNNESKADVILRQQLREIYEQEKQSWLVGCDKSEKNKFLRKMSALSTIFEKFDENMSLLNISRTH